MKFFTSQRFILPIMASLLLFSCTKEDDSRTRNIEIAELQEYIVENQITTQPTWTGLYYTEIEAGTGILAQNYDTVYFEYSLSDLSGRVISSSEALSEPVSYILGDRNVIHGLNEALAYMKVGGKSRAIVPSTLGLGAAQLEDVDAFTTLIYDLELVDVKPGIVVEEYSTESLTERSTESGLKYYIVEQNEQIMVKSGNIVSVHYTGYLSNGKIFDSSLKGGKAATFDLAEGKVISGFLEGLLLMKVGEKFRLIIPPALGYGASGYFPIIPPGENIIFDVEVIAIL